MTHQFSLAWKEIFGCLLRCHLWNVMFDLLNKTCDTWHQVLFFFVFVFLLCFFVFVFFFFLSEGCEAFTSTYPSLTHPSGSQFLETPMAIDLRNGCHTMFPLSFGKWCWSSFPALVPVWAQLALGLAASQIQKQELQIHRNGCYIVHALLRMICFAPLL